MSKNIISFSIKCTIFLSSSSTSNRQDAFSYFQVIHKRSYFHWSNIQTLHNAPDMIDMLLLLLPLTSSLGRNVGSSTTSSPESDSKLHVSASTWLKSMLSASESLLSLFAFLAKLWWLFIKGGGNGGGKGGASIDEEIFLLTLTIVLFFRS